MNQTVQVKCEQCGTDFNQDSETHERQKKEGVPHFCSQACRLTYYNEQRRKPRKWVECHHPECDTVFLSKTGKYAGKFCCVSCAWDYNRMTANETLKRTQASKCEFLYQMAEEFGIAAEHEYAIPGYNYSYDFALPDLHLLFEFDGPNHNNKSQQERDRQKDRIAQQHGYFLIRVPVEPNSKYPVEAVQDGITALLLGVLIMSTYE